MDTPKLDLPKLDTPKAIIIAALIVSATIAFSISTPRYEVASGSGGVVRLDRQTGQIVYCVFSVPGGVYNPQDYNCGK